MFPTIWYQIYYQIAKTSQDWHHFMIMDIISDLTQETHYAGEKITTTKQLSHILCNHPVRVSITDFTSNCSDSNSPAQLCTFQLIACILWSKSLVVTLAVNAMPFVLRSVFLCQIGDDS